MAQASLRKSRKNWSSFLSGLDVFANVGMQIGAVIFLCAALYLLWGIFEGNLAAIAQMPTQEADRHVDILRYAWTGLTIGGILLCICAGVKHRTDNIIGYALLLWGVLMCWGVPLVVNSTIQSAGIGENWVQGALTCAIVNAFKRVGIASMIVSVPFIVLDFWYRLLGIRRDYPQAQKVITKEAVTDNALLKYYCWQMPYCREHIRGFCQAFQSRKPCWRLKSGCYCDEDLLLRAMKKSNAVKVELLKDSYTQASKAPTSALTLAQRRARCRQCFIYGEHQKQKYRLISPLVFPVVLTALWMGYTPITSVLGKILLNVDRFAQAVSFVSAQQASLGRDIGSSAAVSSTAEWVLLGCLGLTLASYMLQGLEYLIFELQV